LARIAGPSVAKELIFTARIIDGKQAASLGIVNHVVEQNEAGDAAYQRSLQLAQEIAPNVRSKFSLIFMHLLYFDSNLMFAVTFLCLAVDAKFPRKPQNGEHATVSTEVTIGKCQCKRCVAVVQFS
jgi:enoyl-CoA hydratase/carnithine racemase